VERPRHLRTGDPRSECFTGFDLPPTASPELPRDLLTRGLEELELDPEPSRIDGLLAYTALLDTWSRRMNLTAHRSPDAIVRRLLLDAVALGTRFGPVESLADVGSGAGLPGIPLAILWRNCRVTLIEPRKKRHHFLRAAVRELGLENATARLGRAEDLDPDPHAVAVAQALAEPGRAIEWMLPWVEAGGRVVVPGSAAGAGDIAKIAGIAEGRRTSYRVPCEGVERTVWIGRRAV